MVVRDWGESSLTRARACMVFSSHFHQRRVNLGFFMLRCGIEGKAEEMWLESYQQADIIIGVKLFIIFHL